MKVAIFGMGYVGLSLGVFLSSKGIDVDFTDVDAVKIRKFIEGETIIEEPIVTEILKTKKNMRATTFEKSLEDASLAFICVGTPSSDSGHINLKYVEECFDTITLLKPYITIVIKSTVIPGTTRNLVQKLKNSPEREDDPMFSAVIFNPEFLREGSSWEDMEHPDRIVIGEDSESGPNGEGTTELTMLYLQVYGTNIPKMIYTNTVNAEMIKYASNAFLATKISFMNEMASVCEMTAGADIKEVQRGMELDRRISPHFLNAGLGYGGSCFSKDIDALVAEYPYLDMLDAVSTINLAQRTVPWSVFSRHYDCYTGENNYEVAVLGLAFKPGTDDMRDAPSIDIIRDFLGHGAKVRVYDPKAMNNAKKIFGDEVTYASDKLNCIEGADFVVLVTEWDIFKIMDATLFKKYMRNPVVFDGRRIYNPGEMKRAGVKYYGVGYSEEQ